MTLICIKWVSRDVSNIILEIIFTQKMPESSGSMDSSILMLENIWYHSFTWSGSNSHEILNLLQFNLASWGPIIGTKFTISCEFGPFPVNWWYHMFSNRKKEEYMESELSGIFQAKMVVKHILLGSLGTQCEAVFAMWCLIKSWVKTRLIYGCILI